MGKPASMMSTPMASRQSATSSFSSKVMVAPGHCSPSRSVVSKIRTQSALAFFWSTSEFVLIGLVFRFGQPSAGAGVDPSARSTSYPLSARPGSSRDRRGSGAHKEEDQSGKRVRRGIAAEGLRAVRNTAIDGDRLTHGQVLNTSRRLAPEPRAAKSAQWRCLAGVAAEPPGRLKPPSGPRRRGPRCRRCARSRACPPR